MGGGRCLIGSQKTSIHPSVYNFEKVNLFSSVFLMISKYSSTSKIDRVQ